jgi:phage terminase small subunit
LLKKRHSHLTDLTEMQKRFCDYLIFNEGRTTHQDAALHAGYSPQRARIEASELLKKPKNTDII